MNQLDQLKQFSTVVADTSEFHRLSAFGAHDALVTPSHILETVRRADDAALLAETAARAQGWPVNDVADQALVRFGVEALKSVAGRVSTLVDARLSFDCAATVARARRIVALYEDAGIARERVLMQIVSTWEGVQAARMLEHEGIACHLTLLFSLCQAVVCADAGVTIVSPFVAPVRPAEGVSNSPAQATAMDGPDDDGVKSVMQIYTYYKKFGIATSVMPTQFHRPEQVLALAGSDLLALDAHMFAALQARETPVARALHPEDARSSPLHALTYNESSWRYALNDAPAATERLAQGIRAFAAAAARLDHTLQTL